MNSEKNNEKNNKINNEDGKNEVIKRVQEMDEMIKNMREQKNKSQDDGR